MAQQTAVEWLIDQLIPKDQHEGIMDIIEEAKQMEKEQIMNAHLTGLIHPLEIEATKQAEQYYNETYGK
jgi:hypothetical protein